MQAEDKPTNQGCVNCYFRFKWSQNSKVMLPSEHLQSRPGISWYKLIWALNQGGKGSCTTNILQTAIWKNKAAQMRANLP